MSDGREWLNMSENHSFSWVKQFPKQTKPQRAEVSFIREGSLGGWRKRFTIEAQAGLQDMGYIGAMQALGYHWESQGQ